MKKDFKKISPYLRGITFDGEKGHIVRFIQDKTAAEKITGKYEKYMLRLMDSEDALKSLRDQYENCKKENKIHPFLVYAEPDSLFVLGRDCGEIDSIKNLSFDLSVPETEKPQYDRNSVVKNRVSVVTGGAQGIGKEIVLGLAEAGSIVFIADMNLEGAEKLSNEINSRYKKTVSFAVYVNITDQSSVEKMFSEIVRNTGGIDIFINNAGVLKAGGLDEMSLKDFSFVTDVNYTGYFLCAKYASEIMAAQNKACRDYFTDIIQINSKSGLSGSKRNSAYAGSKFGGIGLTQSFALELVEYGIKVNSICPGNFFEGPLWSDPDKGLFAQYLRVGKVPGAKTFEDVKRFYESNVPMKRGCRGADLIKAIFYLVDQKYETGQALPVTGGQIMLN